MPVALISTPVIAIHLLALSIFMGSLVAIFLVARISSRVLEPPARVALFASVGRAYATIGPAALIIALVTGIITAGAPSSWTGSATAAVVLAIVALLALGVGMVQAHKMTGLRRTLAATPEDRRAVAAVRRGAAAAGALRGLIVVLTVAAIVLEAAAVAHR